jgi:hypothetical protein
MKLIPVEEITLVSPLSVNDVVALPIAVGVNVFLMINRFKKDREKTRKNLSAIWSAS